MTAKRMFLQTHHQEHVVKGKKIAVKKAASKQGKIYVGKFKDDITEDDIREHFAQVSVSQNFFVILVLRAFSQILDQPYKPCMRQTL